MLSAIGNLRILLAIGWAITLAAMFAAHNRAERFKTEAHAATELAQTYKNALVEQNKVAVACDRATEGMIAAQAALQRKTMDAIAAAKQFRDQLNVTREALRIQQEKDRAVPECKVLLELDISGVCPGYADGVRKRAAGFPGSGSESPRSGQDGN